MRTFKSLTAQEILALAISLEEEDARIYDDFAQRLKADYPATAQMLEEMRAEEDGHRHRLIELHRAKFGDHIPLIRRQDVKGFVQRRPVWLASGLRVDTVRKQVELPNSKPSSSTNGPSNTPTMPASANFSATWPKRNANTPASPSTWNRNSKPRAP